MIELIVLISETASAPPLLAARAGSRTSVIFGVNLTITGILLCCLHQRVTISTYSGTCPTAAPMPRSGIPCGQPKLSSTPSAPVASTSLRIRFQTCSSQGIINDTTNARSGQRFLTSVISRKLISKLRSVINSILLKPDTSPLWS